MGKITDREQGLAIARIGHAVLDKLHTSPVPTFALINGMALGGGLEVTLHCHYRTVSAAAAGIALPECFLGLLPGWGGAYLVPNLIGIERAVTLIIENPLSQNRMLDGPGAYALGLADAMFDGADFLERSLDWAGQVVAGTVTVDRAPVDRDEATWDAVLAEARAFVDLKVGGAAPAPYRALELMAAARTADRASAYAAEDSALADLIMSPELRASLYAFELVRKRGRKPAGAPDPALARPVTKVGVVGAGLMASQLATLFLRRLRVPVVITDLDQERVDKGLGHGARRDRQAAEQEADLTRRGQPAARAAQRHDRPGRLRGLRLRDRGGLRGIVDQATSLRRPGEARRPDLPAGHQHLLAVGDRDGRRPGASRSGWSASTSSTRSRCCRWSRWSAASGPTTPPWPPRWRWPSS